MKKLLFVLAVFSALPLLIWSQTRTMILNKIVVRDTLTLKNMKVTSISADASMLSPSDQVLPTQKAVRDYVNAAVATGRVALRGAKPSPLTTYITDVVLDTVGVDSAWIWNASVYRLLVTGGGGGGTTNLAYVSDGATGTVSNSNGSRFVIPEATDLIAGLLTATKKLQYDAKNSGIQFKDEGTNLGAVATVTEVDFTGSGVAASRSGNTINVNVTGGGSGSLPGGVTGQTILYDRSNNPTSKYPGSSLQLVRRGGVVAHIGDSNTNGRPGYRDSYTAEMFCADCPMGGAISYNIGQNGSTLQNWRQSCRTSYATDSLLKDFGVLQNPGTHVKRLTAGDAQGRKPDLVFLSLGTNDMNNPVARASYGRYVEMKKNLDTLVNWILDNTQAHIFMRMPNPFTFTGSFSGLCSWANAAEAAAYSDTLRLLYLDWKNVNSRVSVYDSHADVFGFGSQNEDPGDVVDPAGGGALMDDNLHPSGIGYRRVVQGILKQIDPSFKRYTKPLDTMAVDYWRYARWSRAFYLRGAATSTSGSNRVLELDVATQFNRIGAGGYVAGGGRIEDTKLAELIGSTNPLPMYQELIDVGSGASDTVYVYSVSSGATMKLTGITLAQWVTATNPDYPQVQGTARNSVTLPAGTVIIYSKLRVPFVPATANLVFTTGNSGGVTISPTGSNPALTLSGSSSTGNTLNVSSTQQNVKTITVNHTGQFGKKGMEMNLSTTQTFLVNLGEDGIQVDNTSALDGYYTRGGYFRGRSSRTTKGTNANEAIGVEVRANSNITTPGIHGSALKAFAETNNVNAVTAYGSGASMNGNLFEGINNGATRFSVDGAGNCVIVGVIWHNSGKTVGTFTGSGTPEGAITASVGSTFHRTDGGANTSFYVKETGSGNTGWVAK